MKTVLFDVELKYQKLKEQLGKPATVRYKILLLVNFLKTILNQPEQTKFQSYYLELSEQLSALIKQKKIDYFSPDEIEVLKDIVRKIFKNNEAESLIIILEESRKKILDILNGGEGIKIKNEEQTGYLNIVLIEKHDGLKQDDNFYSGVIFKLNLISSLCEKNEREDKVEFKNLIDLNETKIIKHLNEVVAIAKTECKKIDIETSLYNFTFYFDDKSFIYSGASLGIGAICLAYNAILINNLNKIYYKFKEDVVFSAEVDEKGNLLKLDKDVLKQKLHTVFYSDFRKFVIPEDNIVDAKEHLNHLLKKYPNRNIELIPIRNYESVFKNLDVVVIHRLKIKEKLRATYKKYNKAVNWTLSILSLLIICFFILIYLVPHLDKNPVRGSFKNGKFSVHNKYDIETWITKTEGYEELIEEHFTNRINYQGISVQDIDNDGKNEIVYIKNFLSKEMKNTNAVICCNSDGKEIWRYKIIDEKMHYDWESDELKGDWVFEQLLVDDLYGDENKEIVANACYKPYFPDRLIMLNSKGELISEYYNSGYFNYITDFDIDGDKKKEVVAVGVNNYPGYRCGAMAVFDPDYLSGSSFKTDPLHSGKAGLEKYYTLFPKTFMTKFNVSNFNIADYLMQNTDRSIVNVLDGEIKEKFADNPHLLYEFDKSLNAVNIGISNQFQKEYESLLAQNKITPIPNMITYLDSLKKEVRYWNGDEFVKHPTVNKYYLKTLDSSKTEKK
ncbi:MAG: hypothetical protein WC358_08360 [Ignavibacteria bacterium]|jgi:hypothetical protein